jgi:hypothetical protein
LVGDGARRLLTPELNAKDFVELLIQNKQYIEAIRFLAFALPIRTAIVWANTCARYFSRAAPSDKADAASDAVDKWLAEPTDENRRATIDAAKVVEFGTPAGSAALAVFFSGGSISSPEAPVMDPMPDMAPNAVAESIMLAAILNEPEKAEAKYQTFLAEGLKLANDDKGVDERN